MSQRYCIVEDCGEKLGPRCISDMCRTCRSGLRYWDNRPYADRVARIQQLGRVRSRLGLMAKPKPVAKRRAVRKSTQAEARA
jgi:hypothetical protein